MIKGNIWEYSLCFEEMLSMILPQGKNFEQHKMKFLTSGESAAFCPVVWELQQIFGRQKNKIRLYFIHLNLLQICG